MNVEFTKRLAKQLRNGETLQPLTRGQPHASILYTGKVVSKGRPRMGAHSVYTPTETREFEKAVKTAAREQLQKNWQLTGAVEVELVVYDAMPDKWPEWMRALAAAQYIYKKSRSDLDNKVKSILDALNGVVYKDDNQITRLNISRRYSTYDGFRVSLYALGLSEETLDNLKKMLS